MFNDYYAILYIEETATFNEIRDAFKRQALKWHPDRNPGVDTTQKMQDINEAYLILKDIQARELYNTEYKAFKHFQENRKNANKEPKAETYSKEKTTEYEDYFVKDTVLKRWMDNAKRQSIVLAKETKKT